MKKLLSLAFIFCAFATFSFAQEKAAPKKTSPAARAEASIERLNTTLTTVNPALKLTDEQRKELNVFYINKYGPKLAMAPKPEKKDGEVVAGQLPAANKKKKASLYTILSKDQMKALAEAKRKARADKKEVKKEMKAAEKN